jgi:hypothetical protein
MFVLKYGVRQAYVSEWILLPGYLVFVMGGLFLMNTQKKRINRWASFRKGFVLIYILIFLVFVIINFLVDGESLNTDRWSALEVSVHSMLNLEYPYDKLDHLGGRSSNFPGLIYIGLPFYLLGDVGLLQPFVFLFTILLVSKSNHQNTSKLKFLFLWVSSLAFLWEVVAKSDLMSNMMIVVLFMYLWHQKYSEDYFQKSSRLGFLSSFLVLTRGVVIIPLTLFLFRSFVKTTGKKKLVFVMSLLVGIVLWSLPILIALPDWEIVEKNNPFLNQTAYASFSITAFFLLIPFLISLFLKNLQQIFTASFGILSIMLIGLFVWNAYDEGWYHNLVVGLYDISYLGMIIPFFLFAYLEKQKQCV